MWGINREWSRWDRQEGYKRYLEHCENDGGDGKRTGLYSENENGDRRMDGIREVFVLVVLGWNSYTDIRERKISLVSVAIFGGRQVSALR